MVVAVWVAMADVLSDGASQAASASAGGPAPTMTGADVEAVVVAWEAAVSGVCDPGQTARVMLPALAAESALRQRLSGTIPPDVAARQPPLLDYVTSLAAQTWDLYAACVGGRL